MSDHSHDDRRAPLALVRLLHGGRSLILTASSPSSRSARSFEWYNLPAAVLIVLSVVKFAVVVALFMHLWDDSPVFTQIFTPALFGGIAMVLVLMLLFSAYAPSNREDAFPIQERHWANYSGQCNSWVRSHVSNKWYCTSPPIDSDRLLAYVAPAPKDAGGSSEPAFEVADLSEDELKAKLIEEGEALYTLHCTACHQANGQGIPGAFPPLAGSDYPGYLDPAQHAGIIINGLQGSITVKGVAYNGMMTAFGQLSDLEIAAIATYERNSWGNDHGVVDPETVASAR